jgi:hypothetical protein
MKNANIQISNLFTELEKDENACKLDIMLTYEVYTERRAMILYPINVLRNLVRLQARTELLGLLDVDMLPSSILVQSLQTDAEIRQRIIEGARNRTAFVIPAFETNGPPRTHEAAALADLLVSRDKQFLIDAVSREIVYPFDFIRFPQVIICILLMISTLSFDCQQFKHCSMSG